MFDPTAFDNIKVVIEGAIYDRDLSGEIIVTDRNDFINTAKMSRLFSICFTLPEKDRRPVSAKMEIEAGLENLASELAPGSFSEKHAGCLIRLQFLMEHPYKALDYRAIEVLLQEIWGSTRQIKHHIQYNPLDEENSRTYEITVDFDRLIGEAQINDLVEMTDFMIKTIEQLQVLNNSNF